MNSIDHLVTAYSERAWFGLLAFTAAILVVLLLRKPCRRLFGPLSAFQLWLLPAVAMLVSQLPHKAALQFVELSQATQAFAPPNVLMPTHGGATLDWREIALTIWIVGALVRSFSSGRKQSHYRRRLKNAVALDLGTSEWPVVQATNADVGPALVGTWKACIVLPADFQNRYDATERALIFAHETMHARRRDNWWSLLAEIVIAVFWFHPLAWLSLVAFHHDQELACDAAVLREHSAHRRAYANAMLKTQAGVVPLPVGCSWTSRHPLTERISMLKQPTPGNVMRRMFYLVTGVLTCAVSLAVYAGSSGAPTAVLASELQLNMSVAFHSENAKETISDKANLALCVKPGEKGIINGHGWTLDAIATPGADGIDTLVNVTNAHGQPVGAPITLRGQLGDLVSGKGAAKDDNGFYTLQLATVAGCPARAGAVAAHAGKVNDTSVHVVGTAPSSTESGALYTLNVNVAFDDKPAQTHMKLCLKSGEPLEASLASGMSDGVPPWKASFSVHPVDQGLMEIQGSLRGGTLTAATHPVIQTKLGQQATVMIGNRTMAAPGQAASAQTIKIDLLPTAGC
ncbi:peptidase M56 [Dyella dinghuensis]|uniref:Peptidase M56 n=1 Tax=Dyella dinghuensis TaxID=1920169 RepID=A0A432LQH9_9GAMM|nr:M56 family metallopeptidase [Dyella dinghuensis]RUL62428.1 peptidase M56 [Dyella dinghuensis]